MPNPRSKIEWTDATWSPVTGCTEVSPGCDHCYAKTFAERFRGVPGHPYEQGFDLKLWPERLEQPLRWARPRMIFVNSMSDLFHPDVPDGFIARIWDVMGQSPHHVFQILTKRPGRMASWARRWADHLEEGPPRLLRDRSPASVRATHTSGRGQLFADMLESMGEPPPDAAYPSFDWMEGQRWWPDVLPNVWLGTSVENQRWADVRIPKLLDAPAALHFLSCEPLLGGLDLSRWMMEDGADNRAPFGIKWVIVGGESGHGARPMHPGWARSIRDQAVAAEVPFFFKQWGEWYPRESWLNDRAKGRSMSMPSRYTFDDGQRMCRVGKRAAGRTLDGLTHDEMPGGLW